MNALMSINLRWLLLKAAEAGARLGATDWMFLDVAREAYPQVCLERVRSELDYLEEHGLLTVERSEAVAWRAKITAYGRDVVDYLVDAPNGVRRPQRAPESR